MKKILWVLSLLSLQAFAQPVTTTQFQAWSLVCAEQGNCSLSQTVAKDKAGKKILMGININYSVSNLFPVLMLRLPAKVNQQSGVGLKIDDHKAIQLPITQCTKKACQSVIKIDDVLLNEMKNGKQGKLAFALTSKKQLTLPISLQGFSKAFTVLKDKRILK